MAYNNGYPMNYQYYQQPMMPQQPIQNQMQQQIPQMQPVQHQYSTVQGGFVRVRNENEARTYFVAPGNSVTFINEDASYVYTKTVDMNQLDRPRFEKYRLVKEDDEMPVEAQQRPVEAPAVDLSMYATKGDMEAFMADLEAIKGDIETFRSDLYGIAGKKKPTAKKEATNE